MSSIAYNSSKEIKVTPTNYGSDMILFGSSANYLSFSGAIHSNTMSIGFNLLHYLDDLIYDYFGDQMGIENDEIIANIIDNNLMLSGTTALVLDKYITEFQLIKNLVEIYSENNDRKHVLGLISFFDSQYMLPLFAYIQKTLIPARIDVSNNSIILRDNRLQTQKSASPSGPVSDWMYKIQPDSRVGIEATPSNLTVSPQNDVNTIAKPNNIIDEIESGVLLQALNNNRYSTIEDFSFILANKVNYKNDNPITNFSENNICNFVNSVTSCLFDNHINEFTVFNTSRQNFYDFSDIASDVVVELSEYPNNFDIRLYELRYKLDIKAKYGQYALDNYRFRVILPFIKLYNPDRIYSPITEEQNFSFLSVDTNNSAIDLIEYDKNNQVSGFSFFTGDNSIYFTLSALDQQLGTNTPQTINVGYTSSSLTAFMVRTQSSSGHMLFNIDLESWGDILESLSADYFSYYPILLNSVNFATTASPIEGISFFILPIDNYVYEDGFKCFEVIDYYDEVFPDSRLNVQDYRWSTTGLPMSIYSSSSVAENTNAIALLKDNYYNVDRAIVVAKDKFYGWYGNFIKLMFFYDSSLEFDTLISSVNVFDDRVEYIVNYNCNNSDSDTRNVPPLFTRLIKFMRMDVNCPVTISWLDNSEYDINWRLNPLEIFLSNGYSTMAKLDNGKQYIYVLDTFSNKTYKVELNTKVWLNPFSNIPTLFSLGL